MPEGKSVLILSGVDVDEPTWSWVGFAETNILDYERRWGEFLLDPRRPLAVVVSLPSYLSDQEMNALQRGPWGHEKQDLESLFSRMRASLSVRVEGPFDLTGKSPNEALSELEQVLCDYEQVVGIAHVPPQAARVCPVCGQQVQLKPVSTFFEIGRGGKLDHQALTRIANRVSTLGRRERRVIFLGCKTFSTDLPKAFVRSGLALAYLTTTGDVVLPQMLVLLRAMLVTGYAEPGNQVLDKLWAAYEKLRGFPSSVRADAAGLCLHYTLVLEGSPSNHGERPYYMAEPCPQGGRPHLQPLSKKEVLDSLDRASKTLPDETLLIVDAPASLRKELAEALDGRPAVWVATGATCASVSKALLREGVEYHLGYVQTTSPYLVYRFLQDHYACVSVYGMPPEEFHEAVAVLPEGGINDVGLRHFLVQLVGEARDRLVIVGAKP